jgi:preprotein translocase subunit SecE
MTETSTAGAASSDRARRDAPRKGGNPVGRFVGGISLFISQILAELRKVVRPTRHELVTYTSVVIAFVSVVMGLVWGADQLIVKLVAFAFGK